jgi:hypothetical protein
VYRGGRTGKVVDLVNLDIYRIGYIVPHKFKIRVAQKVNDVLFAARVEIVYAEHVLLILEEPFAQMRSQKAGSAGDRTSFSKVHDSSPSTFFEIDQVSGKSSYSKSVARLRAAPLYLFALH